MPAHAAGDVERAYADAYYACMGEADDGQDADYGPPPPPGYRPITVRRRRPPITAMALIPYPYPYYGPYYGPGLGFGFGFRRWRMAWRRSLAPPSALGRSDCFCRERPGCMVRPFSFGPVPHAAESQSRQAQSAAAAHPDLAAGHRPHSRRRPIQRRMAISPSPSSRMPMAIIFIWAMPPWPAATPPAWKMRMCGTR